MKFDIKKLDFEKIANASVIISTVVVFFYLLSGYKTYLEIKVLKKQDGKS